MAVPRDPTRHTVWRRAWVVLRIPSGLHGGARLVDALIALGTMVLGLIFKAVTESGWSIWSLPLAVVAMVASIRLIPSADVEDLS